METLELTKHHGLGNDFLVLVDLEGRHRLSADWVLKVCDRHRGIGADGVVHVLAGKRGAAVTMELFNSDGGRAEMSGNGIRCLAQAVVARGAVEGRRFLVSTAAGPREVSVEETPDPKSAMVRVSMGEVTVRPQSPPGLPGKLACKVDVGNPHIVLLFPDLSSVSAEEIGPPLDKGADGGTNVELVAGGPGEGEVTISIWERGAGATLASGTGSTAAAAAAKFWGLVGDSVLVHNPGGNLQLDLSGPEPVMSGEAVYIGKVEIPAR